MPRLILAGHNIGVDWRLLHRHYHAIVPAALIDTLPMNGYERHRAPSGINGTR